MRRALLLLLLPALPVLLSGCPQTIEQACGRDGEGCCDGACGEGLACVGDRCEPCPAGGCSACGVQGAACCAEDPACAEGLRCAGELCVVSCGDGCAPAAERCGGNGEPQLCIHDPEAPLCTVWLSLPACGEGKVCRSGSCTDACETDCRPDEASCGPSGPLTCRVDPATLCPDWTPLELPEGDNACVGGACVDLFCWESPLPAGSPITQFLVDESDSLLAIDYQGNTLLRAAGTWRYDYRARDAQSPGLRRAAACPAVSNAYGVSDRDLLRRNQGGWAVEPRLSLRGELTDVSCSGVDRLAVVSSGGDVLFRRDAEELVIDLSSSGPLEAVALDPFEDALYATGSSVAGVARCVISGAPLVASCRLDELPGERAQRPQRLLAVDPNGVVYASSGDQLFARRGGSWRLEESAAGVITALLALPDGTAWYGTGEGELARSTSAGDWSTPLQLSTSPIVGLGRGSDGLFVADQDFVVFAVDPAAVQLRATTTTSAITREELFGVDGLAARDLFAVGDGGTILHRRGELWLREAEGLTNAALYAVAVVSADEVYAFGEGGTILARRGGVWRREADGLTAQPLYAAFTDGHLVYAGGGEGVLLERPIGPSPDAWEIVRRAQAAGPAISSITGHAAGGAGAADEVVAVDGSCELVLRTPVGVLGQALPGCVDGVYLAAFDDRGELWLVEDSFFPTRLFRRVAGIWTDLALDVEVPGSLFPSGPDLWLLGMNGEVYVHQAEQWREQAAGLSAPGNAGVATADGDIFLVGTGGRIWHRR